MWAPLTRPTAGAVGAIRAHEGEGTLVDAPGPMPHGIDAVPTADELQRAIASVPGVTAAEVSRASNGRDRLRISLAPGEDPEAVAWSVAATLRERFGIALDPAAISARAIAADPTEDPVRVISRIEPAPAPRQTVTWPPFGDAPDEPGDGTDTTAVVGTGAAAHPAAPAPLEAVRPDPSEHATSGGDRTGTAGSSDQQPSTPRGPQPSPDLVAAARAALVDDATSDAAVSDDADDTVPDDAVSDDAVPDDDIPALVQRSRAAISELTASPDGDDLAITATLRLSGREVVGRARGVRTRRGRWRAISEATLDALGSLSAERVRGHVDHVTVLSYADLAHVSVAVTLLTERGEESFLGAALVRDDPDRAVMRATLDAINRRVEPWLEAVIGIPEAG